MHAGEGEEAGGGAQGGDAIWSHRWYAGQGGVGTLGPKGCLLGGYRVPGTKLWVGDYTTEPENGASGVFTHEYGHDLGLPDHYDTAGANDNSADFWTLMASSWPSDSADAIGDNPYHMGAWDKLVLGWSDLATIDPGQEKTSTSDRPKGPRHPDGRRSASTFRTTSRTSRCSRSTAPTRTTTTRVRATTSRPRCVVPWAARWVRTPTLTFRTQYDIEEDWDYAYVEYSDDDGATWHSADGDLSTSTNPNGQNQGLGITGTTAGWVDGTYTIPAGATDIGFRYWTDGAVAQQGFTVDSIQLDGDPVDDATDPSVWTFDGFSQLTDGGFQVEQFHYYLVESRTYLRQDSNLCGVYQFLYGNWLEKWCNARGLVVWYRDSGYPDNNTSEHPGHGAVLVVDSHPEGVKQPGTQGGYWRERIQAWDAAFGVDANDITIHTVRYDGSLKPFPWHADPVSVFDDSVEGAYYDPAIPFASVITPGSGLRIEILKASANRSTYKVGVSWTD